MKFTKAPLKLEEQADLLLSRGLVASKADIISKLKAVSYYRLSAYWYSFKQPDESLVPGTSLAKVWSRYTFDRRLRFLIMDGIERVEVAVRSRMVDVLITKLGPRCHLNPRTFPKLGIDKHAELVAEIRKNTSRSSEYFVRHFFEKYDEELDLPLWMAAEVMTFGNLFTMCRHVDQYSQRDIANEFSLPAIVLDSWLHSLHYVRNLCAHHCLLWSRRLAIKPAFPYLKNDPDWYTPVRVGNSQICAIATILRYLMKRVAKESQWMARLIRLFAEYDDIPIEEMGFAKDWRECPIWKD